MSLYDDLLASNPWLKQFNITPQRIQQLIASSTGGSDLLNKIRKEPGVRQRFSGMYRQDGSMRYESEGEFMRWENETRTLLRQAGVNVDVEYNSPQSLIGFAEGEISPNELRDRLQVWNQVKASSARAREIFYVYAGMTPSDDDLFEAAVDPAREQALYNEYNAQVAAKSSGPKAWEGWIDRATQMGLKRVADIMTDSRTTGATYGETVQRILEVDPTFAREIMAVLYTGGDATGGQAGSLNLTELLDSFEFMAIGAAASESGLEVPTKERLAEIRAAGVDRSKAIAGYTAFGQRRASLSAAVERARGKAFTQTDFEAGEFLGNAEAANDLAAGQNYQEAAGRAAGQFRISESRGGRLVQQGFTN